MLLRVYRGANDPFDPYGSLSVLRSVEHCLRMVYCISLGRLREITAVDVIEGVSRGQRSVRSVRIVKGVTLRRTLFTDGVLHLIRET